MWYLSSSSRDGRAFTMLLPVPLDKIGRESRAPSVIMVSDWKPLFVGKWLHRLHNFNISSTVTVPNWPRKLTRECGNSLRNNSVRKQKKINPIMSPNSLRKQRSSVTCELSQLSQHVSMGLVSVLLHLPERWLSKSPTFWLEGRWNCQKYYLWLRGSSHLLLNGI